MLQTSAMSDPRHNWPLPFCRWQYKMAAPDCQIYTIARILFSIVSAYCVVYSNLRAGGVIWCMNTVNYGIYLLYPSRRSRGAPPFLLAIAPKFTASEFVWGCWFISPATQIVRENNIFCVWNYSNTVWITFVEVQCWSRQKIPCLYCKGRNDCDSKAGLSWA